MLKTCSGLGVQIGVITNLPDTLSDDQGKDMVVNAVLSEDAQTHKANLIGDYVPRDNIITNKAAGKSKPDRAAAWGGEASLRNYRGGRPSERPAARPAHTQSLERAWVTIDRYGCDAGRVRQ